MEYFDIKPQLKERMLEQYGTAAAFIDAHPKEGYNAAKLSKILSPSNNSELKAIYKLCRLLNLRICIQSKPLAQAS